MQPGPMQPGPTPASEQSSAAATKVASAYFAALSARRYHDAYRLWGGRGAASGMSEAQFRAHYARYRTFHAVLQRPGGTEGAAGSSFIEIPVTAIGRLVRGGAFRLAGSLTLRRVNDVDGSSAEQRRWHIAASDLKPRR